MSKTKSSVAYEPREKSDEELERAIGEILSAEGEAKLIINKAEASVKAMQLDASVRARAGRDRVAKEAVVLKANAVKDAQLRAETDVAKIIDTANRQGDELAKSVSAAAKARADELFDIVRGKIR